MGLVHEAYVKLVDQQQLSAESRAHFFGVASGAMRRILVDHARARRAAKRGGGVTAVPLEGMTAVLSDEGAESLIRLDLALERLSEIDALTCKVVECLYFGGLTYDEIAAATDVSPATVNRDLRTAEAWLKHHLDES